MVVLGTIVGTHGLRGELKVLCRYLDLDLSQITNVTIREQSYALESFRWHKNNLLLKLKTIDDLTTAENFRKQDVLIDDALAAETDRYFYEDVMGKKVVTVDGRDLGTVRGILTSPIYEILEVKGDKEILIPWIDVFVKEIAAVITVDVENLEEYVNED